MSVPYMPFYVSDFEADTAHLTIEEDGAYNRLLRLCWRTPGCSVPNDKEWIRRQMRVDPDTFDRLVKPLIKEFFKTSRGRVYQERQQFEYEKVYNKAVASRKNGKFGGRPAKSLKNNETGKPEGSKNNNLKKPDPELDLKPNPKEKKKKEKTALDFLCGVLDLEQAQRVIDHRKKLRKPLTAHAADLLSRQFAKVPSASEAADAMIMNGWIGFNAKWERFNGGKTSNASGGDMARELAAKARR